MMPRQDRPLEGQLIDVSPPSSSGLSTPNSQSRSQPHSHSTPTPISESAPSSSNYGLLSGLWRRISSTDTSSFISNHNPISSLSSSTHSATFPLAASQGDGIHGAFTPPRRTASPRGLPSLEPLSLTGYRSDTDADERLLSQGLAEEIRTFLPERLKLGDEWRLVYSLYQNGSSLATLYKLVEEFRGRRVGFVLVVRDAKDGTFGAYLTEAPHPASSYYGTGECFLWRASMHVPLPPPPSADTTDLLSTRNTTIASAAPSTASSGATSMNGSSLLAPAPIDPATNKLAAPPPSIRFQNFAYTGANDYCIFCETKYLSVGGGQGGRYGLWLDDGFSRGHSAPCDTFCNTALSDEGEKFEVMGVELWVIGAG